MSFCLNVVLGSKKDVVILDVDSKDPSLGMSCPPAAFIDASFLGSVADILNPSGNTYNVTFIRLEVWDFVLKIKSRDIASSSESVSLLRIVGTAP
jgi:hypothetical protein